MGKRSDLAEIAAILRAGESFLLTSHINPDGDAVGSMLAMKRLLEAMGKRDVACTLADPIPAIYSWLPGAGSIQQSDGTLSTQKIVVLLDASRRSRMGSVDALLGPDSQLLVLDHHADEEPDGDLIAGDASYAATGEVVAELFEACGIDFDPISAEALYVAITTDTGSFRFPSTSPRTHRVAAKLMEYGVDISRIACRVFDSMSPERFRLMVRVLDRMRITDGGRVAYTEVDELDLEETGAKSEDLNNLVNYGRNIDGVIVSVLFKHKNGSTKASLRSTPDFDAARVAACFGGGGHKAAAGATLEMPLAEARDTVLACIRTTLKEIAP